MPEDSPPARAADPETRTAVESFYRRGFGAMESGDAEATLRLLADDFVLKGPGLPAVRSREELAAGLRELHRRYAETVEWELEDLRVADGWAVARIAERTTLVARDSGEEIRIEGMHLAVLVRDAEGRWRLECDVSSLDHPVVSP